MLHPKLLKIAAPGLSGLFLARLKAHGVTEPGIILFFKCFKLDGPNYISQFFNTSAN